MRESVRNRAREGYRQAPSRKVAKNVLKSALRAGNPPYPAAICYLANVLI